MGFLNSLFGRKSDPEEEIRRFEEMIKLHIEQIFGSTLYFQGIDLMYSGQPELVEMNLQHFKDIKNRAEDAIAAANSLLQEVKRNSSKVKELKRFTFPPISGHPILDQMTQRAQIVVQTYEQMFPGRSRSQPLSQGELTKLMIEAVEQL